jgi:hypothetical protein
MDNHLVRIGNFQQLISQLEVRLDRHLHHNLVLKANSASPVDKFGFEH